MLQPYSIHVQMECELHSCSTCDPVRRTYSDIGT